MTNLKPIITRVSTSSLMRSPIQMGCLILCLFLIQIPNSRGPMMGLLFSGRGGNSFKHRILTSIRVNSRVISCITSR